jgi:hypothetical protein
MSLPHRCTCGTCGRALEAADLQRQLEAFLRQRAEGRVLVQNLLERLRSMIAQLDALEARDG